MYALIKLGFCILMSVLLPISFCRAANPAGQIGKSLFAQDYQRSIIYHSPQTPGYTCWVGAWAMPDKSLMVTFKQATGPLNGRPRATELLKKMGLGAAPAQRDFTGLNLANIYLRSTNGGTTWTKTAEDAFPGPLDRPTWGGSHHALLGGSIIRAVDGSQLPLVPNLPRRIYFQRSQDFGKTWGRPEIPPQPVRPLEFIGDYGDAITRVRRLRDGRLIATGVIRPDSNNRHLGEPLLMFSGDEGKTWNPQRIILSATQRQPRAWNEWDSAELSNGDLLCVFRRNDPDRPSKQVRWQGILRKKGETWLLDQYRPSVLVHSGHPELLATRQGAVLHIATTGIHWTGDGGATWHLLNFKGSKGGYQSRYYPQTLEAEDGRIYVFSHRGWDNAYGEFDQAIVMDIFRLASE